MFVVLLVMAPSYLEVGASGKPGAVQSTYRNQLEAFRKKYGDGPVAEIKTKHIYAILGGIAKKSTAQAHKLRKRLATLFRLAVNGSIGKTTPC